MKKIGLLLILTTGLLMSCAPTTEDKGVQVQKKESVLVNIKEVDDDNINVLNLTYEVYNSRGQLVKTKVLHDTLPYLGTHLDTLNTDEQDSNGDDSTVTKIMPKKYNYYITFK